MKLSNELVVLIGESGSGKTTYAKEFITNNPNYIRLERDELRLELANVKGAPANSRDFENYVGKVQKMRAEEALGNGLNVIISDTNLNSNTVTKWENFAAHHKVIFRKFRMQTSLEDCIRNDASRTGKANVGRAVIERQFLMSGRLTLDISKKIVLVDVDGTVASHIDLITGKRIRSPYDLNVGFDQPFQKIINEVNSLYDNGYTILIVSGRKSTCGNETVTWLENHGVKFHHIFMRHGWDQRADTIVKQEILNELLAVIKDKALIEVVIDDRPTVVEMWMTNSIPVRPVYFGEFLSDTEFTTSHEIGCDYIDKDGYRRCPLCNALEDF